MSHSKKAEKYLKLLSGDAVLSGEIKKLAKEIKKDHELAIELWDSKKYYPRMLAVLILDKKLLDDELLERILGEVVIHEEKQQTNIVDWLMANQLMKDKGLIEKMLSWEKAKLPMQRRLFWYYQARQRWTGKNPLNNTEELLTSLEKNLKSEDPEVQWAMNFTAGQIGVFEPQYRKRCIDLGEKVGLYKDEKMVPNCTPNYLPEFIRIEAEKKNT